MPKILIVEDEDGMRVSMALALKYKGYDVDEAADGEEGFQKGLRKRLSELARMFSLIADCTNSRAPV